MSSDARGAATPHPVAEPGAGFESGRPRRARTPGHFESGFTLRHETWARALAGRIGKNPQPQAGGNTAAGARRTRQRPGVSDS